MKNINWSKYSKPIILVAFCVILTILRPTTFPTVSNIANVLWSVSVIGIMVCGTIFVFLVGGIDLSIATLCGFSAVVVVEVIHMFGDTTMGVFVGILAAIGVGALAGCVHGFIITTFNIPAFLVTFATQSVFLGLSMVITNNKIVSCTAPAAFTAIGSMKILGFPLPIYFMIVIAVLSFRTSQDGIRQMDLRSRRQPGSIRDFRYQCQESNNSLLRILRNDDSDRRYCSCLHDTSGYGCDRIRLHQRCYHSGRYRRRQSSWRRRYCSGSYLRCGPDGSSEQRPESSQRTVNTRRPCKRSGHHHRCRFRCNAAQRSVQKEERLCFL